MDCKQCRTADVPDISYDLFGTTYECHECGFIFQVENDQDTAYEDMMQESQADIAYGPSLGEYVSFPDGIDED